MKLCHTCNHCYEDAAVLCEQVAHGALKPSRPGPRGIIPGYRIERLLGHGGVSSVYAGVHLKTWKRVAIKLLKQDLIDQIQVKRLQREARITSRLVHPNIALTYNYDINPGGISYLIMELVEGKTLEDYLRLTPTLPAKLAIRIMQQVADGLSSAHKKGIIHRDLKPSNIMLAQIEENRLRVKLIDFGIAKLTRQALLSESKLTPLGFMIGTHQYVSPEECVGNEVDERADIYSLGVILYKLLAGRLPFLEEYPAIVFAHANNAPPPITELRRNLPSSLALLVMRCLEKDPSQRPQSTTELIRLLSDIEGEVMRPGPQFTPFTSRNSDVRSGSRGASGDEEITVLQSSRAGAEIIALDTSDEITAVAAPRSRTIIPPTATTPLLFRTSPGTTATKRISRKRDGGNKRMFPSNKVRIYDLAKELKLESRRVIEEVRREGVDVSVPSNTISQEMADKIRNKFLPKKKRSQPVTKRLVKVLEPISRSSTRWATTDPSAAVRTPSNAQPTPFAQPATNVSVAASGNAPLRPPGATAPSNMKTVVTAGEIAVEEIHDYVRSSKLFVDTSSLMHPDAETAFLAELKPALERTGSRLIVPLKVKQELDGHLTNRGTTEQDKDRRRLASVGLRILGQLYKANLLEWRGGSNDQFPDGLFFTLFSQYRTQYALLLITQDVSLMVDVLSLQNSNSVRGIKPITILEIHQGKLRKVEFDLANSRLIFQKLRRPEAADGQGGIASKSMAATDGNPAGSFRFKRTPKIYTVSDNPLPARADVTTGSTLKTTLHGQLSVTLGELIGWGNEGEVFATSLRGVVAKIYKKKRLTEATVEKLKLMTSRYPPRTGEAKGICWPLDILADADGVIRGYLMFEARGTALATCVFIRSELEATFPYWNRRHLVILCKSLVMKIRFLHRANILMGDINPSNIYVEDENNVFLIDTDSYQVEGYPCPVGSHHFTPPELQGTGFSKLLRTPEHEAFAVATMLFMILHAGKQPYAQLEGGTPTENIKKMQFPYPLKKKTTRKAPEGPWKYIWSHLPYEIKKTFYETFHESHKLQPRKDTSDWLELLDGYIYAIDKGFLTTELFPKTLKPISEHAKQKWGGDGW